MQKKVPYVAQLGNMDCSIACMTMLFRYYGLDVDIVDVGQVVHIGRDGVNLTQLKQATQQFGFKCTAYSHGESPIIGNEVPNSQNVAPFRISPVKEQTKDIITNESGSKVGTITLQYQTEIQGGRPQFLYDKCYLKPNVTTYWSIDESHSEFSGDRIAVYFTFTYWGQFYETAVVYFYPD